MLSYLILDYDKDFDPFHHEFVVEFLISHDYLP